VIDVSTLRFVLLVLTGWLEYREREAIPYVVEENRLLRGQLGTRRLRLTDDDRRRVAARAYRVGRAVLREMATIATPDTLRRWHRQWVAQKWTYARQPGRRGVLAEIHQPALLFCVSLHDLQLTSCLIRFTLQRAQHNRQDLHHAIPGA
jgi:hypothetical protein